MLVVDASVAVPASRVEDGFTVLRDPTLAAPPFMWAEARSALHEAAWRGEVLVSEAVAAHMRLERAQIVAQAPPDLGSEAWRLADELGWAKTLDAEYVALAQILGCRLVTLDLRLRRGADRLGCVILPSEL